MQITVEHGLQSAVVSRPEGTTVGQIINDSNIRAVVGSGENVTALVEGAAVDPTYVLEEGDVVTLQGKAAVKAA
jgi:hypothetical protein